MGWFFGFIWLLVKIIIYYKQFKFELDEERGQKAIRMIKKRSHFLSRFQLLIFVFTLASRIDFSKIFHEYNYY